MSKSTTGDEMTVHLADAEKRWAARGEKALTIPIGGSDAMGIWGYIAAVEELTEDMSRNSLSSAAIVHAYGLGWYTSRFKCRRATLRGECRCY